MAHAVVEKKYPVKEAADLVRDALASGRTVPKAAVRTLLEAIDSPGKPVRTKLPKERVGVVRKFEIFGAGETESTEVYVTVNDYPDGRPGEIFFRVGKSGGLASGALDAVGIVLSIALQHGVPLEAFTSKLRGMKFPPAGFTKDPKYETAGSVLDLVARYLEDRYPKAEGSEG